MQLPIGEKNISLNFWQVQSSRTSRRKVAEHFPWSMTLCSFKNQSWNSFNIQRKTKLETLSLPLSVHSAEANVQSFKKQNSFVVNIFFATSLWPKCFPASRKTLKKNHNHQKFAKTSSNGFFTAEHGSKRVWVLVLSEVASFLVLAH